MAQTWQVEPPKRIPVWVAATVLGAIGLCIGGLLIVSCNRTPQTNQGASSASAAPAPSRPSPASPEPSAQPTPPSPPAATVPDVVGVRLLTAEAQLAAAGFTLLKEVDATGQNRYILEKNNWVVDSQDPPAGTAAGADITITLRVRKPTDQPPRDVEKGVVPDVVCLDLQSAQNDMRAAGFYLLTSHDGTGQGRRQLLDRDWIVIGQSSPPNTSPGLTTHITLDVVKYGEPTGNSGCAS